MGKSCQIAYLTGIFAGWFIMLFSKMTWSQKSKHQNEQISLHWHEEEFFYCDTEFNEKVSTE